MPVQSPLLLAAASGPPEFLAPVAALVVAAGLIGYLSLRVRVVPIVGFLVAGVLIGPDALGLVRERAVLDAAGEVGVILLLFTIGIEFSLEKLGRIRRVVLLGGSVQVLGAVGAVTGVLALAGVPWRVGVFTGFLVAVSSTAIVLKLLGDRGQTGSPTGQSALGLLIFQDLAVVVMVLLLPVLGASEGGDAGGRAVLDLARALGTAVLVIVATILVARRVMPRILEAVARVCSPEVFLLTVIALCLGTAYLTALAGVSVSLGAFLAGLVVSESRHSEHALGEILPLQIIFSAVFFLSVGTLLDVRLPGAPAAAGARRRGPGARGQARHHHGRGAGGGDSPAHGRCAGPAAGAGGGVLLRAAAGRRRGGPEPGATSATTACRRSSPRRCC